MEEYKNRNKDNPVCLKTEKNKKEFISDFYTLFCLTHSLIFLLVKTLTAESPDYKS